MTVGQDIVTALVPLFRSQAHTGVFLPVTLLSALTASIPSALGARLRIAPRDLTRTFASSQNPEPGSCYEQVIYSQLASPHSRARNCDLESHRPPGKRWRAPSLPLALSQHTNLYFGHGTLPGVGKRSSQISDRQASRRGLGLVPLNTNNPGTARCETLWGTSASDDP